MVRVIAGTTAAVIALAVFAGCGSPGSKPAGPALRVTVRDFEIDAPRTVRAGKVTMAVHNTGPDTHEVFVVQADDPALPLRKDGITVDEEAIEPHSAGEIEGTQAGRTSTGTFDLNPGRYELICNMAGHYRAGMHATLVVR
jgi:uncharacterized cupredoxin-like copper-binding protein